ncbi:hypothetical protein JCGZ_01112 [Jatropha curcas]|uniref:Uncharacterized protein n=1 Tax=Jatropha curcas TaxID=180498 RepID=A0A067KNY7_JATCU|nr:hypothetical protein JCGZ_08752 [Jatropha curcas]KDP37832.1 hypothetical protein JCGZ_06734 [Jatropha curcas]KDP39355.1 hypothetical protein JCGZ_01112 [Jatropha curcas]
MAPTVASPLPLMAAPSSELHRRNCWGKKDLREEGSRPKRVPRPQAAGIGVDRRKLVNTNCPGEQLRLAPIEALSAREEAGNTTTSTRRADRHLAFVERWPETRRKGRRRLLSHAQKKKERGRKEETKSVSRSFRFDSNRFDLIQQFGSILLDSRVFPLVFKLFAWFSKNQFDFRVRFDLF